MTHLLGQEIFSFCLISLFSLVSCICYARLCSATPEISAVICIPLSCSACMIVTMCVAVEVITAFLVFKYVQNLDYFMPACWKCSS